MNSHRQTKQALLTSVMALVMCVVMLVGTTFAWFTDTASTNVNKIQAGNLDVALKMKNPNYIVGGTEEEWISAEGKTLSFLQKQADGTVTQNADILWEPGGTYSLPALKVVNNGNLNLKYKIEITGIKGSAKLNEVITWTMKLGNDEFVIGSEHVLNAATANTESAAILTISGKMQETAGNTYMNEKIDGIAITLKATQAVGEYDSTRNIYDQDATYPVTTADLLATYRNDGINMPAGVEITSRDSQGNVTVTLKDEEAFLYFTQVFDMEAARAARETALANGTAERYEGESVHNHLNIWYRAYGLVHVELACDVDMQNRMVTPFTECRTFDGKGHTIKNATVVGDGSNSVGFFGNFDVTDVKMDNIHVKADGDQYAGVISGFNSNAISKVTVTNSTVTGGRNTGAIVGNCYVDLENCVVENCEISGQYKVGGLAGYVCRENGNVLNIRNNTLTNVTVKGENLISGKSNYVIGQVVGNWNARSGGECKGNTVTNVTGATTAIGKVESDVSDPQ